MSRRLLRELGAQTHLTQENGFTFGRLHALEQAEAERAERAFEHARAALAHKKPRRWLRN